MGARTEGGCGADHRAADPDISRALRDGVHRTTAVLRPEAVAEVFSARLRGRGLATPYRT